MKILNFLWYCLKSALVSVCSLWGSPLPNDFSGTDIVVGVCTIIVIAGLIFFISWLIKVIISKNNKE